ncbi:MAG: ATP-binding cassette domain-containing protein [Muribaculaceae bacterium]|nr:ATP-binding cassette domain-containing protein [Muribaculaceae bacterium]
MDYILSAEHITKDFTKHRALDDVSIAVPRGKVYGLLGPNGAGKTTLIRIINHITAPDKGCVVFNGHQLTADDIVNIGYLPEERGLYKKMKVGDQALFFARLKGLDKRDAERSLRQWFEHLEISEWWDKKVEELSKGMAQKVQFIVTVLHRPQLLIFDEPFSGFDPINAGILKREILRLRDEGATVIFSTHNMGSVEELCDEISLINRSRNILSGPVHDLREQFSDNRYSLAFIGNPTELQSAVANMCNSFDLGGIDTDGNATATVSLTSPDALKPFIAAANEAITINSFRRLLPSMDEIFVSAVENYNQKHTSDQ